MVNIFNNSICLLKRGFIAAFAPATLTLAFVGCQREPAVPPAEDHAKHSRGQAEHGEAVAEARLTVVTNPAIPLPNADTALRLQIMDAAEMRVRNFATLHDKLVHLIVVREGLDHFAHLHPDVAADGTLSITFRFPASGRYLLYTDFQPQNGQAMTASATLTVAGAPPVAPNLKPDIPGMVSSDGLVADVTVTGQGFERSITYRLKDTAGKSVTDLQSYLGAMGHLVIIRAETGEYVHAHPSSDRKAEGEVAFEAHFTGPGLYKAWGQFQRADRVLTIPGVIELPSPEHSQ